jgi:hypothetical protein
MPDPIKMACPKCGRTENVRWLKGAWVLKTHGVYTRFFGVPCRGVTFTAERALEEAKAQRDRVAERIDGADARRDKARAALAVALAKIDDDVRAAHDEVARHDARIALLSAKATKPAGAEKKKR